MHTSAHTHTHLSQIQSTNNETVELTNSMFEQTRNGFVGPVSLTEMSVIEKDREKILKKFYLELDSVNTNYSRA